MKNLLSVSILVGVALIIIAGGIIATILGHQWIPIAYFGVGLVLGLFLLTGQPLIEGCLDSEMLWIFPCTVIFGGIMLVVLFLVYLHWAATSPIDPSPYEEDC